MKITIEINTTDKGKPSPMDEQEVALEHLTKSILGGCKQGQIFLNPKNHNKKDNITAWWTIKTEE
jgi:hypothetical protein